MDSKHLPGESSSLFVIYGSTPIRVQAAQGRDCLPTSFIHGWTPSVQTRTWYVIGAQCTLWQEELLTILSSRFLQIEKVNRETSP